MPSGDIAVQRGDVVPRSSAMSIQALLAAPRGRAHVKGRLVKAGLLESLASAIAEEVLGRRGVEAVTVEVRKMRPPVPAQVAWVGVRLRRTSV